jgi:hypothetical protein
MKLKECLNYFILIQLILFSCKTVASNETLTEKNIKGINEFLVNKYLSDMYSRIYYAIFLPENYEIRRIDGEDFIVWYIENNEIIVGGIYLGNHPSMFTKNIDINFTLSAKIDSIILGNKSTYKIYFNGIDYFTEIIINNGNNEGLNKLIHLWIKNNSIEEIRKMIIFFSTLMEL